MSKANFAQTVCVLFARTAALADLSRGRVRFQGVGAVLSLAAPRREVLRWLPLDGRTPPDRVSQRQ